MFERKTLSMEMKEVSDSGQFTGVAAVFGNVDLGGDVIMPGAFVKTIQDAKGTFPLFYEHSVNVGIAEVAESARGLETKGYLNLESQAAREAHSNIRFYKAHGKDFGMSIGWLPIPKRTDRRDGVRILHEVKLFEATLTAIPMNQLAHVAEVKSWYLDVIEEVKAGRRISAESRSKIQFAIEELQALMEEAAESTSAEAANVKSVIDSIRSLMAA